MLSDVVSIEDSPIVLLFGWQPGTFVWDHLTLISGRWPAAGEHAVVIGKIAQEVLRKTVGSTVRIETGTFTVAGVFESGSLAENGAVVMTLAELERLTGQDGKINFLNVKLSPSVAAADAERLRLGIPGRFPGFRAFTATEVAEHNAAIHAVRAMSWAVTAIALVIGTVGVMNTMLMSVFERVREFGILLAIGWRRRRVVAMILSEAVAVAMAGGLVGIACGMAAVRLLERAPWLRGKIEGDFSLSLAGLGLALALVLGVAGGLYPAWRGARMKPSDALRYE
jgi:putative ABC transport system permease protein